MWKWLNLCWPGGKYRPSGHRQRQALLVVVVQRLEAGQVRIEISDAEELAAFNGSNAYNRAHMRNHFQSGLRRSTVCKLDIEWHATSHNKVERIVITRLP